MNCPVAKIFRLKGMRSLFNLVWNNLVKRKFHTVVTLVMVAVATSVLFSSVQVVTGLSKGLKVGMDRLGADILLLPKEISTNVEQTLFTGVPMNIYMPAKVLAEARQVKGIKQASPQLFSQTLDESCCSLGQAYRLVGFEEETDFVLRSWLDQHLQRPLANDELIIGGNIDSFLGDTATILGKTFTVAGRLQPNGSSIDNTIFLPIDEARALAAESPYLKQLWLEYKNPQELISAVLIKVENPQDVLKVSEHLNKIPDVNVVLASKVLQGTKQQLQLITWLILGFSGILWVVSLAALLARYITLIMERKTEVGIFRALGASKTDIFKMVVLEALVTSLAGGVLGLIAGSVLYWQAKDFLAANTTLPFLGSGLGSSLIFSLECLAVALLVGIAASAYPAYKCAALDPARAIVQGELE